MNPAKTKRAPEDALGRPCLTARLAVRLFDEVDRVFDGQNFFSRVIRNFATEFFFKRHNQLDRVQAVSAQIVDEASVFSDLVFLNTEVLDNDLLHAICDITHSSNPSIGFLSVSVYVVPVLFPLLKDLPGTGNRQHTIADFNIWYSGPF